MREYSEWRGRRFSQNTMIRRFGSWREAMRRVGVEGVKARRYEAAELVGEVERVWRRLGRPPGETTLPREGRFSLNAYKKRWGSVRRCCEMIARQKRGEISREEVLAGCGPARGAARKTVKLDVRWEVLKRDRYRCGACGASPATRPGVELNVDHIVPVSRGGGNEESNLRTLCRECNVGRGAGMSDVRG